MCGIGLLVLRAFGVRRKAEQNNIGGKVTKKERQHMEDTKAVEMRGIQATS